MKPKWESKNELRAIEAVAKIDNMELLAEIARSASRDSIRNMAASRKTRIESNRIKSGGHSQNRCPKCGAGMVEAEYYTATQGPRTVLSQQQETDWATMKKTITTTTSTQYSEIEKQVGSICMCCAENKAHRLLTYGRVSFVVAVIGVIAAVILLLSKDNVAWLFIGVAIAIIGGIGWQMLNNSKYLNSKHTSKKDAKESEPSDWLGGEGGVIHVSWRYVVGFPTKNIPKGKVILSRGTVMNLK